MDCPEPSLTYSQISSTGDTASTADQDASSGALEPADWFHCRAWSHQEWVRRCDHCKSKCVLRLSCWVVGGFWNVRLGARRSSDPVLGTISVLTLKPPELSNQLSLDGA
jgi:hypothetical protein